MKKAVVFAAIMCIVCFSAFAKQSEKIEISGPDTVEISSVDKKVKYTASVFDSDGEKIEDAEIKWSISFFDEGYLEWDSEEQPQHTDVKISAEGVLTVGKNQLPAIFSVKAEYGKTSQLFGVRLVARQGFSTDCSASVQYAEEADGIALSGDFTNNVVAAQYDGNGRMISVQTVTEDQTVLFHKDMAKIGLFMFDENGIPIDCVKK